MFDSTSDQVLPELGNVSGPDMLRSGARFPGSGTEDRRPTDPIILTDLGSDWD